jgi:TonB-dependent receptor
MTQVRLGFLASALALAASLSGAVEARAAQAAFRFEQPAQPLASALLAVSARTGAVIIAPAALTAPWRAPALSGTMSADKALRLLLAGTDLEHGIAADGTIILRPRARARPAMPSPLPSPLPEVDTEPVRVEAISVVARPLGETPLALRRASAAQTDILLDNDLARSAGLGLGDALTQLPGVTASQDGGEARQIAIRGVGGRFTRVRVNGMETLTTFGGANAGGGTNRGRAFDYNVFATDLFKQVRLQKTASADLDEGSLGATVEMRTRSAMDLPRRSATFIAQQGYNTLSHKGAPRLSAVVSGRDDEDRFGVLVSAAYSRRSVLDIGSTAGQWDSGEAIYPGFGDTTSPLGLAAINAALHARIPRLERIRIDQSRLGLTTSLEWRPSSATRISADLIYAELRSDRREDLLESFTFRTAGPCGGLPDPKCGINAATVTDARIEAFGGRVPVLIAGSFDNVDVRSEARHDKLNTIFRQATLAASHDFGGGVKGSALLGFSRSDFSNPVQDTLYLEQYDVDGYSYDFSDSRRPSLSFGDANLTEAGAWRLSEFRSDPNWVDNSFRSAAFDLEGPLGALAWRAGVLHKRYKTQAAALTRSNGAIGNVNSDIPAAFLSVPISTYSRLVGAGLDLGVDGAPKTWLSIDVPAAIASLRAACAVSGCTAFDIGLEPIAGLNYSVAEAADAAYLQLALPRSSTRRVWGEGGVRLVRTEVESEGYRLNPDGTVAPARASSRYWQALPSVNLAWDASETLVVRLGAARVMSRPDPIYLRPSLNVSVIGTKLVSAGNPDLRPTRANTVDLAVEWSPAPGAFLSAALYRKAIVTTIQSTITRPALFSDNPFGLPDSVATLACGSSPGCAADLPIWQFARPANTGPGVLKGVEIAFRVPVGRRSGAAAPWLLQGAIAYTRTSVRLLDKAGRWTRMEDALGAPRVAGNLSLAYRRDRLDARVGITYRGAYLATIPAPNGGDVDGVDGVASVDATTRYRVSNRVTLAAEAMNLTNAVQRQFSDRTLIPNYQHHTGREFRMGLRVEF